MSEMCLLHLIALMRTSVTQTLQCAIGWRSPQLFSVKQGRPVGISVPARLGTGGTELAIGYTQPVKVVRLNQLLHYTQKL